MLKEPQKISYDQLKQAIEQIPVLETRALASFAYATGARISELLLLQSKDVYFGSDEKEDYLFVSCPVLKKRTKEGQELPRRHPPVRLDEEWLVHPMVSWSNMCEGSLFNMSRFTALRHLQKAVVINGEPINSHGFRKLRATHLRRYQGFDSYQLQHFFDWASIQPSEHYVKLDGKDILY